LDARTMFQLKAAAIKRGVPLPVVQIMRPWMAATVVALPACEMAAKRDGEPVLDALIARRAQTEGKELVGLETVGEQFSVMAGLPEDFHIEALKETLAMGPLAEDLMETMKQLYVSGNIGMIFPLMKIITPKTAGSKGYAEFQESMITQRNDVMAERALPYLQKGGVFMAVGALHLPGAEGLVEAFRQAGYTVSAIE
ncbi:MAG: TraB/GumN family protein, partial [Nitratireductor sp.]|nr:TraB/GumN family protein [Nitratireductor sp.]